MRNTKFTLIELLTVISIIAILISLLLPTLGEIRKRAVGIQCTANIKTLLQLHLSYTQDHDGLFPAGRVAPNTYGHYWVNVIPLSAAGITAPEGHEYVWEKADLRRQQFLVVFGGTENQHRPLLRRQQLRFVKGKKDRTCKTPELRRLFHRRVYLLFQQQEIQSSAGSRMCLPEYSRQGNHRRFCGRAYGIY